MVRSGELTKQEAEAAKKEPVTIRTPNERSMRAPYFVEYVRQELAARYGADNLYKDGLQVVTTLDLNVQQAVEEELEAHIKKLEKRIATKWCASR